MFAEKSWGSYRVLDAQKGSLTIKAILHAGHAMNYHSHERRDEVWTVLAGEGVAYEGVDCQYGGVCWGWGDCCKEADDGSQQVWGAG